MNTQAEKKAVRLTILKLSILAVMMFIFCLFIMPPLYTLFCEVTGINGKTSGQAYTAVSSEVDTSRTVNVRFIATKNSVMPWDFSPGTYSIDVHPGQAISTEFMAFNPTDKYMVGQAVPSLAPKNAADYFHKTACFCFDQQILAPGERAQLGLRFIVDQALPKNVKSIVLSYTLFDVTDNSKNVIEQRRQQDSDVEEISSEIDSAAINIANLKF